MVRLAGERDIPVIINIHNVDLAKRFANRIIGMARARSCSTASPATSRTIISPTIYGGDSWMEAA